MVPRSVDSMLPEDLDKDIWTWSLPRTAKISVPTGFMYKTMSSHVLLAACRQDELAWESSSTEQISHGAFTTCLVKQLYQEDLGHVTYSTLLDLLLALGQQHPQCEGVNKCRTLFNGAVGSRRIGILEAESVFPHYCTLRRRNEDMSFDIPPGARASVLSVELAPRRERTEGIRPAMISNPPTTFFL